jgi:hypothetical protein
MDEGAPHAAAGPSHDQPHVRHGILSFPLIRLRILASCRNLSQVRKTAIASLVDRRRQRAAVPSLDLADPAAKRALRDGLGPGGVDT